MLYTRNLITTQDIPSYNTAVKQINELDKCNNVELNDLYESQQTSLAKLQTSKETITASITCLTALVNYSCALTLELQRCVSCST